MHRPIEAARIAGFSETSGASSKVEKRRDVQRVGRTRFFRSWHRIGLPVCSTMITPVLMLDEHCGNGAALSGGDGPKGVAADLGLPFVRAASDLGIAAYRQAAAQHGRLVSGDLPRPAGPTTHMMGGGSSATPAAMPWPARRPARGGQTLGGPSRLPVAPSPIPRRPGPPIPGLRPG
jgi:hypothetical protein